MTDQQDQPWNTPAFILDDDLEKRTSGFSLCCAIEHVIGEYNLESLQCVRGVWRAYCLKTEDKIKLCEQGIEIGGRKVSVYSQNPYLMRKPSAYQGKYTPKFFNEPRKEQTRVLIKDLYRSVSNSQVKYMFLHKFGIKITGEIRMANWRNDNNHELHHVKNCDRYVFIDTDLLKVPLPREAKCGNNLCKLFHKGQVSDTKKECYNCFSTEHFGRNCKKEKHCKVCKNPGHTPGTPDCPFYTEDNDNVIAFGGGGEDDVHSNHYPCDFVYNHIPVKNVEECWFYKKAMICNDPGLAQEILRSYDAKHAKRLSKRIRCIPDWDKQPMAQELMEDILVAKYTQVEKCGNALKDSHESGKRLVEAVPSNDLYWGTGLSKEETMHTKPQKWPGNNKLGRLLEKVRSRLFDDWSTPDDELEQDFLVGEKETDLDKSLEPQMLSTESKDGKNIDNASIPLEMTTSPAIEKSDGVEDSQETEDEPENENAEKDTLKSKTEKVAEMENFEAFIKAQVKGGVRKPAGHTSRCRSKSVDLKKRSPSRSSSIKRERDKSSDSTESTKPTKQTKVVISESKLEKVVNSRSVSSAATVK